MAPYESFKIRIPLVMKIFGSLWVLLATEPLENSIIVLVPEGAKH